jgi:hypothetical protein
LHWLVVASHIVVPPPPPIHGAVGDKTNKPGQNTARPEKKTQFDLDMEDPMPPEDQGVGAPIKMVCSCAWSPGIYQDLRLMGKTLDVAWERGFICSLTFKI